MTIVSFDLLRSNLEIIVFLGLVYLSLRPIDYFTLSMELSAILDKAWKEYPILEFTHLFNIICQLVVQYLLIDKRACYICYIIKKGRKN